MGRVRAAAEHLRRRGIGRLSQHVRSHAPVSRCPRNPIGASRRNAREVGGQPALTQSPSGRQAGRLSTAVGAMAGSSCSDSSLAKGKQRRWMLAVSRVSRDESIAAVGGQLAFLGRIPWTPTRRGVTRCAFKSGSGSGELPFSRAAVCDGIARRRRPPLRRRTYRPWLRPQQRRGFRELVEQAEAAGDKVPRQHPELVVVFARTQVSVNRRCRPRERLGSHDGLYRSTLSTSLAVRPRPSRWGTQRPPCPSSSAIRGVPMKAGSVPRVVLVSLTVLLTSV